MLSNYGVNKDNSIHRSSDKKSLKSFEIQNSSPKPVIFTPLTIINCFLIQF